TPLGSAQLNAAASTDGTFVYDPPAGTLLDAGPNLLSVTFTPADATQSPITQNVVLVVNKAPVPLSWAAPAPIAYGTPLSGIQLHAVASVSGSFTYDPPAGTILSLGTQTLHTTFTPSDPNY